MPPMRDRVATDIGGAFTDRDYYTILLAETS